ncbi:hypothetical protein KIPB_009451, partial [Kipferlia bialata]
SVVVFCSNGLPCFISVVLGFLYIQVFSGILRPSKYECIRATLRVTAILLGLGCVCTCIAEQLYCNGLMEAGYDAFVAGLDVVSLGNKYVFCYRILCLLAILQLLVIVLSLKGVAKAHRQQLASHSNDHQRKRRVTKIDVMPWAYGVFCCSHLVVTVCILLWQQPWAYNLFLFTILPAALIEGVCLSVMVYPFAPKEAPSPRAPQRRLPQMTA